MKLYLVHVINDGTNDEAWEILPFDNRKDLWAHLKKQDPAPINGWITGNLELAETYQRERILLRHTSKTGEKVNAARISGRAL